MEQINRDISPAPSCLTKIFSGLPNYFKKGLAWKDKYLLTADARKFNWGSHDKRKNSEYIVNSLGLISNNHCFYCDINSVTYGGIKPEIDHFNPKTLTPIKAYYYPNLNLCCGTCNSYKSDKFNRRYLLNFANPNYNFDDYYYIDFATGHIIVLPNISYENKKKARYTLFVLGVNKDSRPILRRNELNAYNNSIIQVLDDFSYRYFINRA